MDKIYSRKRIKVPRLNYSKENLIKNLNDNQSSKKMKKIIKIFLICIIAISVISSSLKQIEPILEKECISNAKSIATDISNKQASIVMNKYKYEDLCNIVKDNNENIKMIKSNVIVVNKIISDVTVGIQNELNKLGSENIYINLGNFTGNKFLSGRGPKVYFKIFKIGNVETDLKSEFISAGINQTMHKIYLQIDCKVIIVTPFSQIEEKITNQILIAEAIILGNVPNSFYNLEGIKQDNLIDIVE